MHQVFISVDGKATEVAAAVTVEVVTVVKFSFLLVSIQES